MVNIGKILDIAVFTHLTKKKFMQNSCIFQIGADWTSKVQSWNCNELAIANFILRLHCSAN